MIRKTRVRTAAAAAALATSVAIAVTATGAARADNIVPQPAADGVPAARDQLRVATRYVVTAGDSYWAIAEDILPDGAANSEVQHLTDELMSLNTSKLGYDAPSMLHPGDVVEVPATPAADRPVAAPVRAAAPSHRVVAGDSYWGIAESALGADAAPADVLAKTEQLIELNRARLGYDDPQMLHPGDVVYLEATEAALPPVTGERKPTRAQTPDSPPLSELAIIAD